MTANACGILSTAVIALSALVPAASRAEPAPGSLQAGIEAYGQVDYDRASELLTPLAEQGEAEAARYLGMMHDPSLHGSMDLTYRSSYHNVIEALRWYVVGHQQGSALSTCLLEFLMAISDLKGVEDELIGVALKNYIRWTLKDELERKERIEGSEQRLVEAAEQGDGEAAFFRLRGCGPSERPRGQFKWKQAALEKLGREARAGGSSAPLYLGHTYWFDTDTVSAYAWYEVALARGNRHAEFFRFLMTQALRQREYASAEAAAGKLLEELGLEFAPLESEDPILVEKRTDKQDNFDATPIRLTCRRRPETGSHRVYTDCVQLWSVR